MTDPFVMAAGRKGIQGPGLYVVFSVLRNLYRNVPISREQE
jgi:hypothetical protein